MNTMNHEQIRETILRTLSDVIPNADTQALAPDISFHDQLELDSIDFLRLMMSLEKEMNVTIFDFDYSPSPHINIDTRSHCYSRKVFYPCL